MSPSSATALSSARWAGRARASVLVALAFSTLLAPVAMAEPVAPHTPAPSEFAAQLPLTVSGNNGVVQLLLPIEVYQTSRSPALDDLRVYNSAGVALPYALHQPSYRTRSELREQLTNLYPIYAAAQSDVGGAVELNLRAAADGSLSVSTHNASEPPADAPLAELIVDLGPSDPNEVLESLSFELSEASDYRARLAIERSDDLELWDGAAHGNVDWISASDASTRLVHNRMELPYGNGRYLKVRWLEGQPVSFSAIRARWRGASVRIDPALEVRLTAHAARVAGDFAYSTSPAINATEIGLDLPEANTVMPVSIGFYQDQRPPQAQAWLSPRVEATFYRLSHNGRERSSGRISVAPMSASEWVVRPRTQGQTAPTLVLRWQPQTLVFNAQGQGFVLAVGAAPEVYRHWQGGPSPMNQVAPGYSSDEIEQLERAGIGALQAAPNVVAETAAAKPDSDPDLKARQRRFLLWSVLGFGVLLLGYMSWRLYGQMSASSE